MSDRWPHGLFDVTGIELEYMIVDRDTLSVRPIADELIRAQCGTIESEIELNGVAWSNEVVLHVIEFKTNGPSPSLTRLPGQFQDSVRRANGLLEPMNARLMPTAMHPWMDPHTEMRLWPHEYSPVYDSFHRIFDCRGHGWANLQSMHVNLPFGNDEEFGRLHAAVRLVLPILPALSSSSPIADGRPTGMMDTRLDYYRNNARRIPSVSGRIIPEPVFSRGDYEGSLLRSIYDDIAPHDPEGILRYEWINARGCIARFDRGAIEIRVIDVAECPIADLSIAWAVISLVRAMVDERFCCREEQRRWEIGPLADLLLSTMRDAERTLIDDERYLRAVGYPGPAPCTAGDLWRGIVDCIPGPDAEQEPFREALGVILEEGCLSRRILARVGDDTRHEHVREVYAGLCESLSEGRLFRSGV